jgi:N-acetylmuramoyl-L-alanine amidase
MRTCWLLFLFPAFVLALEEPKTSLPAVITATTPGRTPARAELDDKKHIIAIDVGHSEKHPGAISATGRAEYEYNRDMAAQLKNEFAKHENFESFVILAPKEISLTERARLAAVGKADLFVSIHHDSAQDKYLKTRVVAEKDQSYTDDDRFSGYSIFVSRKNPRYEESLEVARRIGMAMGARKYRFATHHAEKIQGENRLILDPEAGVYEFNDLIVLKSATMPAVLVECGVIVNLEEEKSLRTLERQQRAAAAIAQGVMDYFTGTPPLPTIEASKHPVEKSQPTQVPESRTIEASKRPLERSQPTPESRTIEAPKRRVEKSQPTPVPEVRKALKVEPDPGSEPPNRERD